MASKRAVRKLKVVKATDFIRVRRGEHPERIEVGAEYVFVREFWDGTGYCHLVRAANGALIDADVCYFADVEA